MSEGAQDALFGQQLVRSGLINQKHLDRALEMQVGIGGRIGKILLKMGFIKEADLLTQLARHLGVDLLKSPEMNVPANIVEKIPSHVMREKKCIPVCLEGDSLILAMADPCDFETIEEIRFETGYNVKAVLTSESELDGIFSRLPFFAESGETLAGEVGSFEAETDEDDDAPLELDPRSPNPAAFKTLMRQPPRIKVNALIELLLLKGVISKDELEEALREQTRKQ